MTRGYAVIGWGEGGRPFSGGLSRSVRGRSTVGSHPSIDPGTRCPASSLSAKSASTCSRPIVARYGLAPLSLSEHAVHAWEATVALDPGVLIEAGAAAVLWARLARIASRFHNANVRHALTPIDVATDGAPASTLEIRPDGVTLIPDKSGTVQVRGPVESLVRLVYGRLDPNRRPHDHIDVRGDLCLDTLTTLFPGY